MKATIYTLKVADVKTENYASIRHRSQAEHDIILDDLISVGPLQKSEIGYGAYLTLLFNREHNKSLTVSFPLASVGEHTRQKLVADWRAFCENGALPPDLSKALDDHRAASAEALQIRESAR